MAKKIDELERPKIPGYIDMSKVNSASAGVAAARDAINNLNYDTFKQGSQYGNLKKSYEQQGQTAMKDTLGQVAARTGGMASSYATSAANQSYNNYMQKLEDAARSMFNEEYSKKMDAYNMAQQEYGNAYGEYRDAKSDAWTEYNALNSNFENDRTFNTTQADKKKQGEIDIISSDAYYGRAVSWEEYFAAHPDTQLTQDEYESIVAAGEGRRTDENRTNVDNELMSILSDEDFNWDTDYESIAGLIANSSFGEDYWRQFATDKATERSNTSKTNSQNTVKEMWKAGLTPTDKQLVAAGYKTQNSDGTYSWTDEGLAAMYSGTGLTDTELEQIFGAEGFDWDTYDFDKDGKVGKEDTDGEDMSGFFANSSYGMDYWRQYATDKATERSNTSETNSQNTVKEMWKAGLTPTDKQLVAAGYKTQNSDGTYSWTDEGLAAMYSGTGLTDTELEQIFGAEGFDWDTYDFDKDGKVGKEDTDGEDMSGFFANSSYGMDYWRQFATNEQQRYADRDTKDKQTENTNRIDARLKNGASLEDIEKEFGIGPNGKTWESVTGMSKDEWKVKQTGYKQGSYKFQDTSAGRSEIVNKMLDSGKLSLSASDADNFDYLYGDGAYDAVQTFVETISPNNMGSERFGNSDFHQYTLSAFENEFNRIVDELYEIVPGLDYTTQVLEIVKKANPEMYEAATNLSSYKFAY